MKKLAARIYQYLITSNIPFDNHNVAVDLHYLYQREDLARKKEDYYVSKIVLVLELLLVGVIFAVFVGVSSVQKSKALADGQILRGEPYEDSGTITVLADRDGYREQYEIEVAARELTEEEFQEMAASFLEDPSPYILGNNRSLQEVSTNLILNKSYETLPLTILWDSNMPNIMGADGTVSDAEATEEVTLTAEIHYMDYAVTGRIGITVVPVERTEAEASYLELSKYIANLEENSRTSEYFTLPTTWQDETIDWSYDEKNYSGFILLGFVGIAVVLFFLKDHDLHTEVEKRKKLLQAQYPELVQRIALYVGAGYTTKGALILIAEEYSGASAENTAFLWLEEVVRTCREIEAGISENIAYEHWGRRAGAKEYIRLCTILQQNNSRGDRSLPIRLQEEAEKAYTEKLLHVRKIGEEASVKLLLPMVMMLMVILIMIVVSAFGTI